MSLKDDIDKLSAGKSSQGTPPASSPCRVETPAAGKDSETKSQGKRGSSATAPKPAKKKRKAKKKTNGALKTSVNPKLFAEALIRNELNATAAYLEIKPEVTVQSAGNAGYRMMKNAQVIKHLLPLMSKLFTKSGITTEWVFRRWVEMSQANPYDYFTIDEDGVPQFRPDHELTPAQKNNVKKLKVLTNETKSADGERLFVKTTMEIEMVDQQKAVDTIGKHLGLLVDRLADEDVERIGDLIERGVGRIRETKDLDGWRDMALDVDFQEVK